MLQEGYFDKVYYRFWRETGSTANVFAIHGLGGHSIWFDTLALILNKNKINFISFDLPGFGQSTYPKGKINSYYIWTNISKEILARFLMEFNVKEPVFILGHSMGALIVILLSKTVKATGWILSVPAFKGNKNTWPLLDFFIPTLFKSFFCPGKTIAVPFGPELITKNKETQQKIKKDPYRVFNLSAEVYKHVFFLTLKAKSYCKYLLDPVLVLEAKNDFVCSNKATDLYFNKIKSKDKCMKIYTNSYHDLLIEDELEQVADDITKWIKEHIS